MLTTLQCLLGQTSDRVREIVVSARPATFSTCRIRKMELSHEASQVCWANAQSQRPSGHGPASGFLAGGSRARGFFTCTVRWPTQRELERTKIIPGGLRDGSPQQLCGNRRRGCYLRRPPTQSDAMAITKCLISEPLRSCNGTVLNRSDFMRAVSPDGSKPHLSRDRPAQETLRISPGAGQSIA